MFNWLFNKTKKNECVCEEDVKPIFEKVENTTRYRTANPYYYKVVDGDVKYLFTEKDLKLAKERAEKNPEDVS